MQHELAESNPSCGWNLRRFLRGNALSFVAMIPWPLLGLALSHRWFDNPDEALLLFGGITCIPIALVSLAASSFDALLGEGLYSVVTLAVWVAALLLPNVIMSVKARSRPTTAILLVFQSLFSFAQAAMGILVLMGKAC